VVDDIVCIEILFTISTVTDISTMTLSGTILLSVALYFLRQVTNHRLKGSKQTFDLPPVCPRSIRSETQNINHYPFDSIRLVNFTVTAQGCPIYTYGT